MFWRMAGFSTASPVETILDKENFTLEDLLDEDEIIQECKALNSRLVNFLREQANVKQLIHYIVEEAPEDTEKQRTFKLPFIACEIFTCEVDVILKTLVEDEESMDLLFSFLDPEHPHSTLLAGYFSKVVVCLLLRKTAPLMNYIRAHQDILNRLVDLIGITSIMEVLIRLVGADEHIYASVDSMQWLEDTNVLEMIVEKFSSSDSPAVHANAAETLCALTRSAPPALASKISSPSFIKRLFCCALESSRPKSVLINLLCVCISLLDPKRLTTGAYYVYTHQMAHGSGSVANPETVEGMLESLGDLLKLLEISSEGNVLLTTYGKLQPPLGKHRLKVIEFISVLFSVSSDIAEKELIRLGAVKRILELFFEYPFNNFLHHHVERIIISCLESKNPQLVEHLLFECNLIGRILEAENNYTLAVNLSKPTTAEGRSTPRIGNIGHLTRIANKLVQLGNSNNMIQMSLQENSDWVNWQTNVLLKRNALENVFQWICGRPTSLQDRTRDSDDDDYQDRDFDVAALANNLSQAFQYGIYSTDGIGEVRGSVEHDDEDVYFDDESAEVVISSLRLGDDQDSPDAQGDFRKAVNQVLTDIASSELPEPEPEAIEDNVPSTLPDRQGDIRKAVDQDLTDIASSELPEPEPEPEAIEDNVPSTLPEDFREAETSGSDNPHESFGSSGTSDPADEHPPPSNLAGTSSSSQHTSLPNGELQEELQNQPDVQPEKVTASSTSADGPADSCKADCGGLPGSEHRDSMTIPSQSKEIGEAE